ncbi:hypothetical protein V7S43_008133 [Phytophthora oleae]|uniref:Transposase Tc1-like domain-containing protein n=1 Tax=Phytophthora oleae TaxID=2107226 RepID=A0ABD3FL15_9STRA
MGVSPPSQQQRKSCARRPAVDGRPVRPQSQGCVAHLAPRHRLMDPAVVKSRASAHGRKKVDRRALCERIAEVPIGERKNQLTLQLATNTSSYRIQRLLREGYLRRALSPVAEGQSQDRPHEVLC